MHTEPLRGRLGDLSHMNRSMIVAILAAVVAGFGGGYVAANIGHSDWFGGRAGVGRAVHGQPWSLFGHPRAVNASRRGAPRPEGFAVWRTRLDTSGGQPLACVEMSRPLDPARSYGDYVLVSPELDRAPAVS